MFWRNKRITKHATLFILLACIFMATLCLLASFLNMKKNIEEVINTRWQSEFKAAYEFSNIDDNIMYEKRKDAAFSVPEIKDGIFVMRYLFLPNENTAFGWIDFMVGDYEQVSFPLENQSEIMPIYKKGNTFVGKSYIDALEKELDERYLSIENHRLHVDGVLKDITTTESDSRIICLTKYMSKSDWDWLNEIGINNFTQFYYYSNKGEYQEDLETITKWFQDVLGIEMYPFEFNQDTEIGYLENVSNMKKMIEYAIIPVFVVCFFSCLLVLRIYIKGIFRNIAIFRANGISYQWIFKMIFIDFGLILLPSVICLCFVTNKIGESISLGLLVDFICSFISVGFIMLEFYKKGRCL